MVAWGPLARCHSKLPTQPETGKAAGALKDKTGHPFVNPGLRSIALGDGSTTALFLATGFNGATGMIGRVDPD